jgi:arsenate reductase
MSHVLFVCIQNAGRSQMAHALFERAASGHEARSREGGLIRPPSG